MNRKSVTNLAYYAMFHGFRYIFPLLLTPLLAIKLGAASFADFILWNSCVWTSSLLMEFGFYLYGVNKIAVADGAAELDRAAGSIISAKLILLPLAVVGYVVAVFALGLAERQPLGSAIGLVAMLCYGWSFAWYFQGLQRGGSAVALEGLPLIVNLAIVFIAVHSTHDMWIAAAGQTVAACLTISASAWLVSKSGLRLRLSLRDARDAISAATPFFIERCCFALYATATPMIIAGLSEPRQVAFYGIADKIGTFLSGLSNPVAMAVMPLTAQRIRPGRQDYSLSMMVVGGLTAITCALAAVLYVFMGPLITTVFPASYVEAIEVARWSCVAAVFMTFQLALSNFVIIPAGRAQIMVKTSLLALAISLTIQVLLVPTYGALGSVMARTASECALAIVLGLVSWRLVRKVRPVMAPVTD